METRQEHINRLVKSGQSGDKAAIEKLIMIYNPLLTSMVNKTCWNPSEREDAMQDAVLALIQAVKDYDTENGVYFPVYLKQQIFYRMMERSRRAKSRCVSLDTPSGEDEKVLMDMLEDETPPPLSTLIESEKYTELYERLEDLPGRQRQVICYRYFYGLRPKDIASRLGIALKTVENLHTRAIKNLRKTF